MTSLFDSMVRARREHTPWTSVSVSAFMRNMAEEGEQNVTLTCKYDYRQVTRFWWTIEWTDETGKKQSAASQSLDLCMWRAAETVMEAREQTKQKEAPGKS